MQTQFEFDAEGVFNQPIKPLRIRKRKQPRQKFAKWIEMSEGSTLEARSIRQTMRVPKLLSSAMPRVILKEKFLARPRSAESEFGLKWASSDKRVPGNKRKTKTQSSSANDWYDSRSSTNRKMIPDSVFDKILRK